MLIDQINNDIIAHMKAKNSVDATILKTLKADIQKVAIDSKKAMEAARISKQEYDEWREKGKTAKAVKRL